MQNLWILFLFVHSFLKGTRDGMRKTASNKSSTEQILFFFTLIGFLMIIPFCKNVLDTDPVYIFYVFIKSVIVSVAWIFSYIAIKNMSVSFYGVMDMSRMLFTTLLGIVVLGEALTKGKIIGMTIVIVGLVLVNLRSDDENTKVSLMAVCAALADCFLISVSATMDKVLTRHMTPDQLQFFFMLFSCVFYGGLLLVKEKKITLKSVKTNYWIPLMSLSLVFGDRLLFSANASPHSEVSAMAIIKQSAVFFSVLTGFVFFKEKRLGYKLFCSVIILGGVICSLLIK